MLEALARQLLTTLMLIHEVGGAIPLLALLVDIQLEPAVALM